jgi:hypothetical protein
VRVQQCAERPYPERAQQGNALGFWLPVGDLPARPSSKKAQTLASTLAGMKWV